ncbi:uncharacterized protein LOC113462066 [Phoenix dactylifera]|uniref:Uncharacterized protein LOC113462066 n=1 Tax=Phoenix dactylifera TaxID=42345 RepID=A0A8B9ANN5_PHODC|nr:uncharacterized protein LOC113462066 [Phoenix dactylifera]
MSFDDQELLKYLKGYDGGHILPSWGAIDPDCNPYHFGPDRLHAGSARGSSGVSYYYVECAENPRTDERKVADHSGCWQRSGGEIADRHGSNAVMYKQKFKFVPRDNGPRTWVMTEYTLHPNKSGKNKKAICAIQEEGSSRQ